MKKIFIGFVIGVFVSCSIFATDTWNVALQTAKILVNGTEWSSTDKPALIVNDSTYLPVRAIGEALGVPVEWNNTLKQIEIGNKPVAQSTATKVTTVAETTEAPVDRTETPRKVWIGNILSDEMLLIFESDMYFYEKGDVLGRAFNVEIKNKGQKDLNYDAKHFVLAGIYPQDVTGDEFITSGTLKPGESVKGILLYRNTNIPKSMPFCFKYDTGDYSIEFVLTEQG